jgi:hypothetical protein
LISVEITSIRQPVSLEDHREISLKKEVVPGTEIGGKREYEENVFCEAQPIVQN